MSHSSLVDHPLATNSLRQYADAWLLSSQTGWPHNELGGHGGHDGVGGKGGAEGGAEGAGHATATTVGAGSTPRCVSNVQVDGTGSVHPPERYLRRGASRGQSKHGCGSIGGLNPCTRLCWDS